LWWSTTDGQKVKLTKVAVDLIGVGPEHAMWTSFELDVLNVLDHFRLPARSRVGRQDAIVVPVRNEARYLVAHDIFPEILDGRRVAELQSPSPAWKW